MKIDLTFPKLGMKCDQSLAVKLAGEERVQQRRLLPSDLSVGLEIISKITARLAQAAWKACGAGPTTVA